MKSPQLIDKTLSKEEYDKLLKNMSNPKSFEYDPGFSRYTIGHDNSPILKDLLNGLTEKARNIFDSQTLMPTYAIFAHYEGQDPEPSLYKHKDTNACTYTIDMCVYQNEYWGLWVDGTEYCLYPNQSLAYYGNDQEHWREKFPNPETNCVAMIFFHFAEPDHWYFKKGPSYIDVIWKRITEEEWNLKNARG
jgi:hypothetical protein